MAKLPIKEELHELSEAGAILFRNALNRNQIPNAVADA